MRGGEFADGVPGEVVGTYAPRLQEPEQRHLEGEQGGLGVLGPVHRFPVAPGEQLRKVQAEFGVDRVKGLGEHRVVGAQFEAHAETLGALPGEEERGARPGAGPAGDDGGRGVPGGERAQPGQQLLAVGAGDGGAVPEGRAAHAQLPSHDGGFEFGACLDEGAQPLGLRGQRLRGAGGQGPEQGGGRRRLRCPVGGFGRLVGHRLRGGLLHDHVGVRAADPERGDARPAGVVPARPRAGVGQQAYVSGRPVDLGGRFGGVQGGGQHAVAHRHDRLDDARDPGGGLRVPDVRLDRAEPERGVGRALAAVGGEQRLRLDGVAEGGAGAVRLDQVHLGGGHPRGGQRRADDALLGGAVGRGEAVGGAVGVDGRAADHGEDLVAVAPRVREALQDQDAEPFGEARAVRVLGEGPAPAVRRERALPAELHIGAGGRHHRHSPGQGERRLALAQRLGREVQGDERGGAGGVDGEGRALQAERVGDAARDDAPGSETAEVVVVHEPREHAGAAAAQGLRVDARALQRLPGPFEQQALLRVHQGRLARADAEEAGVEVARVVQESALAGVRAAGLAGLRVVEVRVPAAVGGERADAVPAALDELPQLLGRADAARVAARHADDRDRFARRRGQGAGAFPQPVDLLERGAQRLDHPGVLAPGCGAS